MASDSRKRLSVSRNDPQVRDTMTGVGAQTALRDWSQAQFAERYQTDRFTATILASRMRYIVKHMSTGLMTTAFSIILRDWYDFAATISGPPELNYAMSTGSDSLSIFMLTMPEAVRNVVEEFGVDNLRPGDVVIANDPYRVGLHVNDVAFIRPVFLDNKIIAFVSLRAHQLDMGGIVPGGFSGTKRSVFETGLVIPPTLLYRDGRPVPETLKTIFDNSRFGSLLLPDIKTIYQCLLLGERLFLESAHRYGVPAILGAIRYCCDVSADAMGEAIQAKIPDGDYEAEDVIDADGVDDTREFRVRVKITKAGGNLEFDFSNTSPQARTSINCSALDVKAVVGVALKVLIEPKTPLSSGLYRNIDLVIPPGTVCSANPDGPIFMYWEPGLAVLCAIYKALGPVLGEDAIGGDYGSLMLHNASGKLNDGTPWLTVALCGGEHGPWGGTKSADGDSYTVVPTGNNIDPATEAVESEIPVVMMRKDYVIDSAGAGQNRGGAAVRKDTYWLSEGDHIPTPLHSKSPSGIGAMGGGSGTTQACWMFSSEAFDVRKEGRLLPLESSIYKKAVLAAGMLNPDTQELDLEHGRYFYYGAQSVWKGPIGTSLRFVTGGGGGWGDPLKRDPDRVRCDVRDEYVSIDAAYGQYGVVISGDPVHHPEQLQVDVKATLKRRSDMQKSRA